MTDVYEDHFQKLMAIEDDDALSDVIQSEWEWSEPLFRRAGPNTAHDLVGADKICGCLTQIRKNPDVYAASADGKTVHPITSEIVADDRIPKTPEEIDRQSLAVFLEWQRRLDEELRG